MTLILTLNSLVYAGVTLNSNGVPPEIAGSKEYVEIPVKDMDGKVTGVLQQTMTKNGNTGKVMFWVKAYAYKTAEQIKTGVVITYPAQDGSMPIEFFDQIQTFSLADANWPSCEGLYVQQSEEFRYDGENANQKRIILTFKCGRDGKLFDKDFYRHTEKDVAFSEGLGTVGLTVLNGGKTAIDYYNATLNPMLLYSNQNIYNPVKKIQLDSKVKVDLNLVLSEKTVNPKYHVIQSDTVPTLPIDSSSWSELVDLEKVKNSKSDYLDLVDRPNYVSVQHYIYAPGYQKSPNEYGLDKERDRGQIFKYRIGDFIEQKATIGKYYTTKVDSNAFFDKGEVTSTTLKANFVPPTSGKYQLCVRSVEGTKGEITVNGKKQLFVNDESVWPNGKPQYRTNEATFELEAGKSYPINIETKHTNSDQISPHLMYRMEDEKEWHIAYPDVLQNQDPSNGASRAAKFWGFIVPDVSGEFNFGLYADDGAYGYIVADGTEKVFVDSFKITSAKDQSNGVTIEVDKDKAYPFYLEWYEGNPMHEALTPRYKKPEESNWHDIPASWFRPSNDSSVAEDSLAVYKPTGISAEIPLLNTKGDQYVVLEVTDQYGQKHQILEGPLTIPEKKPVTDTSPMNDPGFNCLVPEAVSNITTMVTYKTACQDVSYSVDLSTIFSQKISGKDLVKLKEGDTWDLATVSKALVVVLEENGTKQFVQAKGEEKESDKYNYDLVGNKIVVSLKNEADKTVTVPENTKHNLLVYLRVGLGKEIKYEGETDSYRALLEDQDTKRVTDPTYTMIKVPVEISRKPKIADEEVVDDDGSVHIKEVFDTTPKVDTVQIPITLYEIPKVY